MKTQRQRVFSVVSEEAVVQLADLFRLMGDPTRLRIILACLSNPINVSDIAARLDLSPSLVSHHLRLLRAARVFAPNGAVNRCFTHRWMDTSSA